jgi:hypothetical protein
MGLRRVVLPVCILLCFAACAHEPGLVSLDIVPSSVTLGNIGDTAQLKAIGTFQRNSHPATTQDLTGQVNWASVNPNVATVNSSGLVTAAGGGPPLSGQP